MDNIQSQIDSRASQGGGDVLLAPVRYKPPQIIVRPGVNLIGQGRIIYDWQSSRIAGGTVFEIGWGGGPGSSGDPTKAAVQLNTASGIRNIGFDYPTQLPGLAAPIEYGSSMSRTGGGQGFRQARADLPGLVEYQVFVDVVGINLLRQ